MGLTDNNNDPDASGNAGSVNIKPIGVEEVLEPLNPEEKQEVRRQDFLVPLEFFLEGININPQTSEEARNGALLKVRQAAIKRVAIRNEIKKNPDILKTPADNPLLIAGFHRCGTTMLHRMLSCDKQFLTPKLWEMMEPLPPGRVPDYKRTDRYLKAKKDFDKTIYDLNPEAASIPEYSLELTDECMSILQDYFLELPEMLYIKTMTKWAQFVYNPPKENVTNAYKYYKKLLQCLFYKSMDAGQRILVKSGMHPLYMDTYDQVFPDAKYVLIYRDPCEMVPSLTSLADQMGRRQGYFDDGLGKRMAKYYGLVTSRGVNYLKNMPQDKCLVLGYREMVKDPIEAVKKIYSHFNLTLRPEVQETMQRHMEENKQHKHGKHKYGLADFGLTEDDIREQLKDYIEFFKNGTEKMP